MLEITIPAREYFDEQIQEFVYSKEQTLQLEHSLVSISKWESKWCKSFIANKEKTYEETINYVKCMTLTPKVDPNIYMNLTKENIDEINSYISAPMTATYISDDGRNKNREPLTSELIYYYMTALNIPFECQKWHLNRLITLIQVCNIKSQPPKKMSTSALMSRNAALNAARRKKLNTTG